MTEISVIVPAFNAEDTITPCVNSILKNTLAPLECLVVDDGSTDQTAERAEAAGARVLRLAGNMGPGLARNQGAKVARGHCLAFTDADCEVPLDWLATLYTYYNDPSITGITGPYSGPVQPTLFANLIDRWLRCNQRSVPDDIYSCVISNLLIAKETFFLAGGFPRYRLPGSHKYYYGNEDEEFARLLCHRTGKPFRWLRGNGPYHRYRNSLKAHLKQQRHWAEAIVVSWARFPAAFAKGKSNYQSSSGLIGIVTTWLAVVMSVLSVSTGNSLLFVGVLPFLGFYWQRFWFVFSQEHSTQRKFSYLFITYPFFALTALAWTLGLGSGVLKALRGTLFWKRAEPDFLPAGVEAD